MNFIKFFILNGLSLFFLACGGENDPSKFFNIQLNGNKKEFQQHETINASLTNKKGYAIDSIRFSIDGEEVPLNNGQLVLNIKKLGVKMLKAHIGYEGKAVEVSKKIKVLAPSAPELYTYEIINEYPHDIKAFTQGLEFYNDTLYESTGRKGSSSIRKVDYRTGKILQKVDLDSRFFGEGITLLNDKLYQLSWQSKTGFIYNVQDFSKLDNFQYGQSKEGWGLCNNGTYLFKSDGTEKIWMLDPNTLIEQDYIQIVTNKSIFNQANELEYVDGKIYANVWQKESMMIIDAQSGAIEGVVNFGGLKERVKKHPELDVLNGIAYNSTTKTLFVTGKNWDTLFEVRLIKKADGTL